ncbi:hypothetical protein ACIBSV_01500 [Embleya sp. NPDC050154]|uniref:hypothetical protein n=1 Tax=Embleya sp. NPDC050154 TaxID=3363988 RepID=UPI0037A0C6B1
MVEYDMFKAREREILAGAEQARVRQAGWRARRAEAKARRAERVGAAALATLAVTR